MLQAKRNVLRKEKVITKKTKTVIITRTDQGIFFDEAKNIWAPIVNLQAIKILWERQKCPDENKMFHGIKVKLLEPTHICSDHVPKDNYKLVQNI